MATVKERLVAKANAKASDTAPKFSVVTTIDLAGHKAGDTLTMDKHIANYFRELLNFESETQTRLTDDQILVAVKHVDVAGLSPEDAEIARVEYLEGLSSETLTDDREIPSDVGLAVVGGVAIDPIALEARAMGAKADESIIKAINVAIEGRKDWNGAPIILEGALERLYGREGMLEFPPINTRRQGVKSDNNTGRSGEIVGMTPEQWQNANSPVDYYKIKGTDAKGRFVVQWYAGTVDGIAKMKRLNQIKALLDTTKAVFPDTPAELLALKGNGPELESLRDTLQDEINGSIGRISEAVWLWQFKNDIAERLPKVELTFIGIQQREDGTEFGHEIAAKRKKPIQFLDISNPKRAVPSPAYTLGACKRMSVSKAIQGGGTVAALVGSIPARKKKMPGSGATAASPTITTVPDTVEKFHSAMNGVASYVLSGEGKKGMIKAALARQEDGDEFAYSLVTLFDYLKEEIQIENYRPQADAYQTRRAIADGAAKEAEAKAALEKREAEAVAKALGKRVA